MHFEDTNIIRSWTVRVLNVDKGTGGSGVFLDKEGHIATNAHVVQGGKGGKLAWYGAGNLSTDYKVLVETDPKKEDVAIIQSEPNLYDVLAELFVKWYGSAAKPNLPKFMRKGRKVKDGAIVAVCGYPEVVPLLEDKTIGKFQPPTISIGVASIPVFSKDRIVVSAPVYPGNSGGPIFVESGNIVGLAVTVYRVGLVSLWSPSNEMSLSLPSTYGEMIPISTVRDVAN